PPFVERTSLMFPSPVRSRGRDESAARRRSRQSTKLWVEPLEERLLLHHHGILPADVPAAQHAAHFVEGLYQVLLGRTPSSAEVAGWADFPEHGATAGQAAQRFLASSEYALRVVGNAYEQLLGREPEAGEAPTWEARLEAAGGSAPLTVGVL